MNIQAYLESGILESYVMGTTSPQENQQIESLSRIYPEVRVQLLHIENVLEEYALRHQVAAPLSLKEAIFSKINFNIQQGSV